MSSDAAFCRCVRCAAERLRRSLRGAVTVPFEPLEILSADQVETIHEASLRLLEEVGMEVLHDGALDHLRAAGAAVEAGARRVRFDRSLVTEMVARAPAEVRLHARNPRWTVTIGGSRLVFTSVGGPVYCADLDRGRRVGTFAEMCDYLRVVQSLGIIHQEGGGPFEPEDLPADTRYLDMYRAFITLLDKSWHATALGRERAADAIDMTCIALGVDRDALARSPGAITVVNTNSPLRLDGPMAEGLMEFAAAAQPAAVTPFTLAGAMSPVTLAGALAQQNAEVLAVVTLAQIVRPGAPMIYGGFTSNVDMRSGAPAFGTPEYAKGVIASGQLARRYGLPYRSSNVNAANIPDAQAGYESGMSVWACVLAHANLLYHGAGWLEGGLTASFEKLILDAEALTAVAAALGVPAGGGEGEDRLPAHPPLDHAPEEPRADAARRANRVWKELLRRYEAPPMDPAVAEALDAFVARRKAAILRAR